MPSLPAYTRSVAFLAAAHALAFAATDWGLNLPYRLGEAMGSTMFACALVSVVLAWRRSTRKHIPLATLLVVLVAVVYPDSTRASDRESVEADLAAMNGMLDDSVRVSTVAADAPWPAGSYARSVRATREASEDVRGWMDSLLAEYRIESVTDPEGWLSAPYLADAGRYPEVGDFYARYGEYMGRVRKEVAPRADSVARFHLEEAGLSANGQRSYLRGIRDGIASREGSFEAVQRLCRDAVELHAFLVRVDPRVHLDPDGATARFEDPAERKQAEALLQAVQAEAAALERLREQARRSRVAAFDSIRSLLPPTPELVPDGGT